MTDQQAVQVGPDQQAVQVGPTGSIEGLTRFQAAQNMYSDRKKKIELGIYLSPVENVRLEHVTAIVDTMLIDPRSITQIKLYYFPSRALYQHNEEIARILGDAIARMENLDYLCLNYPRSGRHPDYRSDAIEELRLAQEEGGKSDLELFWEGCAKNQSMTQLTTGILMSFGIRRSIGGGGDGSVTLLTLLNKNRNSPLNWLCLNWGKLEDTDVIVAMLEEPTPIVTSKNLAIFWAVIGDPLPQKHCLRIANALVKNTTFVGFQIGGEIQYKESGAALGDALASNRHLRQFYIEFRFLCEEGLNLLTKGIKKNRLLRTVSFLPYYGPDQPNVGLPPITAAAEACQRIADHTTLLNRLGRDNLHGPPGFVCTEDYWAKRLVELFTYLQKNSDVYDPLLVLSVIFSWIDDYPYLFLRAAGLVGDIGSNNDDAAIGTKNNENTSKRSRGSNLCSNTEMFTTSRKRNKND